MLARPLRRADLVVGRWLGLSIVIGAYAALSGLLAIAVVALVSGHLPPQPFMAIGYLTFEAVAVLTVALTLGTRLPAMAAGAISVVLFGVGWFVGVLGNVAVAFDAQALYRATEAFRFLLPTDGLWRGVIFGLEPPLVLLMSVGRTAEANPFFAPDAAARGVHGLERRVGRCSCWLAASPCSGAGSCSPRGREASGARERLRVEQVRLRSERARRPPGVVDRPEHVRGHRLRTGRPVQHDAVQPPRDAAPGQVQLGQVADVRPRVALEHRAQLGAGQAACRPRPARRAGVPGRAVRGDGRGCPAGTPTSDPTAPLDDTNTYSLFSVEPPPVAKKNALTIVPLTAITWPGNGG